MSGDYFVVTSFGIQLLATAVFTNWTAGTGGANGLPGIPPPDLFGLPIETHRADMSAVHRRASVLGCLCFCLIMRAPFGRLLRAIREDETAVAAAGKNVLRAKVSAAALAGAFAGTAGGLYATFLSFIDPSSFDLDASILLLTMVVVGGARTLAGSIIGPFLLLALPQVLTLVEIPTTDRGRGASADLRSAADRVHAVPPARPGGGKAVTAYLQVDGLDHSFGGLPRCRNAASPSSRAASPAWSVRTAPARPRSSMSSPDS